MALTTLTVDQVLADPRPETLLPDWPGLPEPEEAASRVVPADGLDAERARVRSYLSGGGDA